MFLVQSKIPTGTVEKIHYSEMCLELFHLVLISTNYLFLNFEFKMERIAF